MFLWSCEQFSDPSCCKWLILYYFMFEWAWATVVVKALDY